MASIVATADPGRDVAGHLAHVWRSMSWRRALRAGLTLGSIIVACHALRLSASIAASGVFFALLIDSGGPYRLRLRAMLWVTLGNALALVCGLVVPDPLAWIIAVTGLLCFALTFARVTSQFAAQCSVYLLVVYFSGLGAEPVSLHRALLSASLYVAGGAWAMMLSLAAWPLDPFRPARLAVADCFRSLAAFTAELAGQAAGGDQAAPGEPAAGGDQATPGDPVARDVDPASQAPGGGVAQWTAARTDTSVAEAALSGTPLPDAATLAAHGWQRRQRALLEAARLALASTPARAPSRSVRARALAILLETSDLLLARTMRLTEHACPANEVQPQSRMPVAERERLLGLLRTLAAAETALAVALADRPADDALAFAPGGSLRTQLLERPLAAFAAGGGSPRADDLHRSPLPAEQRDTAFELSVAFNAVYGMWSGAGHAIDRASEIVSAPAPSGGKVRGGKVRGGLPRSSRLPGPAKLFDPANLDTLRENWNLRSAAMRHSLRLTVVGLLDVLLMRALHLSHSFWLPMTSIILLQPYSGGTLRRGLQRMTGTVLGGVLAAVLAAAMPDARSLTLTIPLLAGLTIATYTVDYAVYTFFLTPTFVLLALPHPHDWRFAGVRIGLTVLGAAIALAAMRLLWPGRAEEELTGLLRRGTEAETAYLAAMLAFWRVPADARQAAERTLLAPARRACGLALNDAEEAIDRMLQEPQLRWLASPRLALRSEALIFATYLRRFTQTVTTLAPIGRPTPRTLERIARIRLRMERVIDLSSDTPRELPRDAALAEPGDAGPLLVDPAEEQMQRLDRQSRVLERSALFAFGSPAPEPADPEPAAAAPAEPAEAAEPPEEIVQADRPAL